MPINNHAKNSNNILPAGCSADIFKLRTGSPEISQVNNMAMLVTLVTAVDIGAAMAVIMANQRQKVSDFSPIIE
ncbi:hypothetical protein [Methylobacter tundripaludum]|uniref:hypothetical protein n=1 Tax=Methylobacter tundripaludum TaxID=173365 RepID=UPI0020B6A1CD|nr:hypothetical protein [Methylobacter tundripaludum]